MNEEETRRAVKEAYDAYHLGSGLNDEQIDLLIRVIEAAIPFLQASPAFSLVYREAVMDREALMSFRRERSLHPRYSGIPAR